MKTLVIGLDGLAPELVQRFVEDRELPTFEKFLNEGSFGELESELPPVSGPAWTSFATGRNPGKHGIFDFVVRDEDSYSDHPINSTYRKTSTFWEMMSQEGDEVGIMNIPGTYPASAVNGFMVSGMLSPSKQSNYTYPETLKDSINDKYRITHKKLYSEGKEREYLDELYDVADAQMETAIDLMNERDPDHMSLVFSFTDSLHHFFWGHFTDDSSPFQDVIPEGYERADRMVNRLISEAGEDVNVLIVSDHGGGPLKGMVQLNLWLHRQGYLKFKSTPGTLFRRALWKMGWTAENVYRLISKLNLQDMAAKQSRESRDKTLRRLFLSWDDIDWSETVAYSRGHIGQIFLNRKDREPEGIVPADEAPELQAEIEEKLQEWKNPDTGEAMVSNVFSRDEIYEGENLPEAPELLIFLDGLNYIDHPGVVGSNKLVGPHIKGYSGGHRMNGTILAHGPDIDNNTSVNAHLTDIAPTLLALMGAPIPEDVDGSALTEIFSEDFLEETPPSHCDPAYYEGRSSRLDVSEEEEEEMRDRLRDMGYLD